MGIIGEFTGKVKQIYEDGKIGAKNFVRGKLLKKGFHLQKAGERHLPTYKMYEPMITYMQKINHELITKIESRFAEISDETIPAIEKAYEKIGCYKNSKFLNNEKDIIGHGTSIDEKGTIFDPDLRFTVKIPKISDPSKLEICPIPIPKEKIVYIPADRRTEKVRYYGYNTNPRTTWEGEYYKLIKKICDAYRAKHKSDSEKIKYIGSVESSYNERIRRLFRSELPSKEESIGSIEKKYYNLLRDIDGELNTIMEVFQSAIFDMLPEKIRFKHTYFLAYPLIFNNDGTIKARLSRHIDPPTDPRGMPWEVDPKTGKLLVLKWIDEGKVTVSDIKKKIPDFVKPRFLIGSRVPNEFIDMGDILDIANWVNSEFDAYRDDLRDGRYHPKSLTIHDYMVANNECVWDEWEQADEMDHAELLRRRKYAIKLVGGGTINGTREPSNLNPAFDLRFFKPPSKGTIGEPVEDWDHVGRLFYYENTDGIFDHIQDKPMASTRGTAMYLLDKFLKQGMLYDEVHAEVIDIGNRAGWDYGPRTFNTPLHVDPFEIKISSVNAELHKILNS